MRTCGLSLTFLVSSALLIAQPSRPVRAILEGSAADSTTNAPLLLARAKLVRGPEEPVYSKADPRGHFAFSNLQPGTYQLYIESPGYRQFRYPVTLSAPRPNAAGTVGASPRANPASTAPQPQISKTVDEDGTIHATVIAPMVAFALITGRVTDPYGVPMAGATIEIDAAATPGAPSARPYRASTTADSTGVYRAAALDPGTYLVAANKPNGIPGWAWQTNYRVTYYPGALDAASAKRVTLVPGQQVHADIQILKQPGISLSGHVVGLPVSSGVNTLFTRIALVPEDSGVMNPNMPFVNVQSEFELKDVLPGRYTLYAQTEDPFSEPMAAERQPLFGLVKNVEIGAQDMAGFDLNLEPLRNLTGMIEAGAACGDLPLVVQLLGRNPMSPAPVEAAVGPDRQFVLHNVPVGRFQLSVGTGAQRSANLTSAVRGTQDLMKVGLDSPGKDDAPLKLTVECPGQGSRQ
jgi:hypothetical protein